MRQRSQRVSRLLRGSRAPPAGESRSPASWEAIVLIGACVATGVLTLRLTQRMPHGNIARLIVPAPSVLWGALRFGVAGAASTLLIGVTAAMHGVEAGDAPSGVSEAGVALEVVSIALAISLGLLGVTTVERRRVSRRCAAAEERHAALARSGGVFSYSFDALTGVLDLDPVLGDALGLPPMAPRGRNWWRFIHADDVAALREFWTTWRAHGTGPAHRDFRMIAADGGVRWFRGRVHRDCRPSRLTDDTPSPLFGTVTDITALKRAEVAALERSRELAHVARTAIVGELAAALAHEIRQPLTAILMNSQTAMRVLDARPHEPHAVREILEQLAADGRRAADVLQRVRAFARNAEVERGPVDINGVVREAVQLVRHDTIRRRVEIGFASTPEPLVVVGDRVQLQQVVLNLVLNALDALAEGPPERERRVVIETARATRAALVTVRDTGPGIPLERQTAIFEPFVTTKRSGLGMGLAISRIIIEAHDGTIRCESEPPATGATFVVEIPLGAAAAR